MAFPDRFAAPLPAVCAGFRASHHSLPGLSIGRRMGGASNQIPLPALLQKNNL
jgi:hypothetical protein